MRTRAFWLIYASGVASCVGLFVPMVHLAPYAQDAGYSAAEADGLPERYRIPGVVIKPASG